MNYSSLTEEVFCQGRFLFHKDSFDRRYSVERVFFFDALLENFCKGDSIYDQRSHCKNRKQGRSHL